MAPRELGGLPKLLFRGLALDDIAHALARSVACRCQDSVPPSTKRGDEIVVQAIRPKRRQADLSPRVDEGVDHLGDLRVIGRGGADQAYLLRMVRDQRENAFLLDDTHAVVRGAAHHTVRAAAVTAAFGLDQEHVAELGVWRDDLRERGEGGRVRLVDGWKDVAVCGRHEHVGLACQGTHGAGLGIRPEDHAEGGVHRLVRLAHDHRVDERGERERVAERQWATG